MFNFGQLFPYSDMHQLNLDWMLKEFKEIKNMGNNLTETLENTVKTFMEQYIQSGDLGSLLSGIFAETSNPIFVNSISKMTDHNRVYVLTPDYTIYYWNGTNFVTDGNTYAGEDNYIYRGNLVAYNPITISNYASFGFYQSGNVSGKTVTDFPDKFTLEPFWIVNNYTSEIGFQTVYTLSGKIAYRQGTDGDWKYPFDTTMLFSYRGDMVGDETITLSNYIDFGLYQSGTIAGKEITDFPENIVISPFYLVNLYYSGYGFQIIFTLNGDVAYRQGISGSWIYPQNRNGYTWASIGDSISNGTCSTDTGMQIIDQKNSFIFQAARRSGFKNVLNLAVNGSGYVRERDGNDNFMNKLQNADVNNDVKLLSVYGGVNDWQNNSPLGNTESVTGDGSVCGNLKYILENYLTKFPNATIVIVSPICRIAGTVTPSYNLDSKNTAGYTMRQLCQNLQDVCDTYNAKFINFTEFSLISKINASNLLKDGVHPTLSTSILMGISLAGKI